MHGADDDGGGDQYERGDLPGAPGDERHEGIGRHDDDPVIIK